VAWHLPTLAVALLAGLVALNLPPARAEMMALPDIVPVSARSQQAWERRSVALEAELGAAGLALGAPIFIRIYKASRELELFVQNHTRFQLFRSYRICEVSGELGPKRIEGDRQAPEGFYSVSAEWLNPESRFHLAFNIGYPNELDQQQGRSGSLIMVHGGCASIGCFAMTDSRMEEIYILAEAALRSSQRAFDVHIFPFRMSEEKLADHRNSPWYDFWRNLKLGHDHFEHHRQPPTVAVGNGRYIFR
jgi:murein L,D-transpeptidase YafK